jgi:hypothetical protein
MSGEPETRFGGGELKLVTMPSLELKCGDNANTAQLPLKNCGFIDVLMAIKSTRYRYGHDCLCIWWMFKAVNGRSRQVTEVAMLVFFPDCSPGTSDDRTHHLSTAAVHQHFRAPCLLGCPMLFISGFGALIAKDIRQVVVTQTRVLQKSWAAKVIRQ